MDWTSPMPPWAREMAWPSQEDLWFIERTRCCAPFNLLVVGGGLLSGVTSRTHRRLCTSAQGFLAINHNMPSAESGPPHINQASVCVPQFKEVVTLLSSHSQCLVLPAVLQLGVSVSLSPDPNLPKEFRCLQSLDTPPPPVHHPYLTASVLSLSYYVDFSSAASSADTLLQWCKPCTLYQGTVVWRKHAGRN